MKTSFYIQFCLLFVAVAMTAGCSGGGLGRVSGTVTLDGKPLADVEVLFAPEVVDGNGSPGVYSFCVTDSEGKFELKTRYQKQGAVVGPHLVTIQYPDEGDIEETRDELMDALQDAKDAKAEGESYEESDAAEIKARLAKLQARVAKRPKIPTFDNHITVPSGGIVPCDFKLISK